MSLRIGPQIARILADFFTLAMLLAPAEQVGTGLKPCAPILFIIRQESV
jgi:hypothetical protein